MEHFGAASTSRLSPMLNMARAADPILPGYFVPNRIMDTLLSVMTVL